MRGVHPNTPVDIPLNASANLTDLSSSLSIHLDDLILALAPDNSSHALGGDGGPRRTRRSRIDESFLSFRPEPMEEEDQHHDHSLSIPEPSFGSVSTSETPHPSQANDESIEVYKSDEPLIFSSSQPWNLNGSILDITIDEDEVRSLPLEDDAGEEDVDFERGEYVGGAGWHDGSNSYLKSSLMMLECPSTPSQSFQRGYHQCYSSNGGNFDSGMAPMITQTPSYISHNSGKELVCGGGPTSSVMDLTDRLVGMCFGTVGTATPVVTPSKEKTANKSPTVTQERHPWTSSPRSHQPCRVGSINSFPSTPSCCVADGLRLVQEDMFHILGCATPVPDPHSHQEDTHEMSDMWPGQSLLCFRGHSLLSRLPAGNATHEDSSKDKHHGRARPSRLTLQERAERIRRFRIERNLPHQRTGLTLLDSESSPWTGSPVLHVSATPLLPSRRRPLPYRKSRSLTVDRRRGRLEPRRGGLFGSGRADDDDEEMEGGYDSDPEVFPSRGASSDVGLRPMLPLVTTPALVLDDKHGDENHPMNQSPTDGVSSACSEGCGYCHADTDRIVHESLNLSWTLTWHAPDSERPRFTDSTTEMTAWSPASSPPSSSMPLVVTVSIERGTLVHGDTVMLEPSILWRQAYVPTVQQCQRRRPMRKSTALKVTSPFVPTTHSLKLLNLTRILPGVPDSSKYPLARPSCSIAVQTTSGEYFVFEAATPQEQIEILKRWKVVVARFVTLAILEQFEVMADEFFAPRSAIPY